MFEKQLDYRYEVAKPSPEGNFMPKKHTIKTYAQIRREAKKRKNIKKH